MSQCTCGKGWDWNRVWADVFVGGFAGLLVFGAYDLFVDWVKRDQFRMERQLANDVAQLVHTQQELVEHLRVPPKWPAQRRWWHPKQK